MSNIQSYKILIKTKGPLHIGSGKEITKKEYILDSKTKKAKVLDFHKFTEMIYRKNLFDKYQQFVCSNDKDLYAWLRANSFTDADIDSMTKYVLDCSNANISDKHYNINTFIKDPYGNPYVPGSSLKGALRTVLLAYMLNKNSEKLKEAQESIKYAELKPKKKGNLAREIKDIEASAFNTLNRKPDKPNDAVNDIMQGIVVGDSLPLTTDKLTVCQKLDMHIDGTASPLSIFNECIVPGTVIKFQLTIDSNFCKLRVDDIRDAIKCFFKDNYFKVYADKFAKSPSKKIPPNTILLGGNVGFLSKTVIYNIFNEQEAVYQTKNIMELSFQKHKNDIELGISPHILHVAKYGNETYHMGECIIQIKDI